jgi:hypothetical protein
MSVILATWEVNMGRIMVGDQLGKKVKEDPISSNKSWTVVVHVCCLSYMGSINRVVDQA